MKLSKKLSVPFVNKRMFGGVLMLIVLLSASCLKKTDFGFGKIMVVNASAGFGPADVFLDGTKINATALAYPNNTGYVETAGGTRFVQVTNSGSTSALFDGSLNIIKDINQTLFLFNQPDSLNGLAVADNFSTPPAGSSLIRFFQLSPGQPLIDIGVLTGSTFTPLFTARPFETSINAVNHQGFGTFVAGTHTFDVRVNGTGVSLFTSGPITLQNGGIYTLFLRGKSGSGTDPIGLEVINND